MKKGIAVTIFAILLFSLLITPALAQENGLAISRLSWRPETPYPGQDDLVVTIAYHNDGETVELGEGEAIIAQVLFLYNGMPTGRPFTTPITAAIIAGTTGEISVTVTVPPEGKYEIEAKLLQQTLIDGETALIELDQATGVINVASALPPGVANLFAGLGMFAAIMAIIAVGTEVVIDSLRVALGMKSKVTAMQAYKRLEAQLPGQLSALGASAADIELFRRQSQQIGQIGNQAEALLTVQANLQAGQFAQAFEGVFARWDIRNGRIPLTHFTTAAEEALVAQMMQLNLDEPVQRAIMTNVARYIADHEVDHDLSQKDVATAVADILRHLQNTPPQNIATDTVTNLIAAQEELTNQLLQIAAYQLRDALKEVAEQKTRQLLKIANLSPETVATVANLVGSQIAQIGEQTNQINISQLTMANVIKALALVFTKNGQQIGLAWLEQQSDHLLLTSKTQALQRFEYELQPIFTGFGLDAEQYKSELAGLMNVLDTKAQLEIKAYLDGLRNLLLAVEARRNDLQSPSRKAWRAIRNSTFPFLGVLLGPIPVLLTLFFIRFWLDGFWVKLFVFIIAFILGLVVAWFVQWVTLTIAKKKIVANKHGSCTATDLKNLNQLMADPATQQSDMMMKRAEAIHDVGATFDLQERSSYDVLTAAEMEKSYLDELKNVADRHETSETAVCRWYIYFVENDDKSTIDRVKQIADKPLKLPWWLRHGWYLFSLGDVLSWLETHWNFFLRRDNEMGQMAETIKKQIQSIDVTNLAAVLQEREDQHRDQESSRVRWFRLISIVVGITLALFLQIDAARLLDAVVPGISAQINIFTVDMHNLWSVFPPSVLLTPGIILTGFAASAGSAFWHDQLDRLQSAKRTSEQVAQIAKELQET